MDYGSPIVAIYTLEHDVLHKIPFESMAVETLEPLTGPLTSTERIEKLFGYETSNLFL